MWLRLSRRLVVFLLGNRLLRRLAMDQVKKVATTQAMRYARDTLRPDDTYQRGENYVEIPVQVKD